MGEKLWKRKMLLNDINCWNRAHILTPNYGNVHHFLRYQGYCSLWIHSTRPDNYMEILKRLHEALNRKKAWNLVLRLDSPPWQCSSSQGALCQAVSAQKSITEIEHPPYYPEIDSEWLVAVSKNKVCLKGTKILGYWTYPKNVTTPLKAIPQQGFQKRF
jgi:hypothetical protein